MYACGAAATIRLCRCVSLAVEGGLSLKDVLRRLNDRVGIERDRVDSPLDEEVSELGIIRRSLAADADLLAGPLCGVNSHCHHLLDGAIALVKKVSHHFGIAIKTERQLGQIVRADRVPVKDLEKLIREYHVGR